MTLRTHLAYKAEHVVRRARRQAQHRPQNRSDHRSGSVSRERGRHGDARAEFGECPRASRSIDRVAVRHEKGGGRHGGSRGEHLERVSSRFQNRWKHPGCSPGHGCSPEQWPKSSFSAVFCDLMDNQPFQQPGC